MGSYTLICAIFTSWKVFSSENKTGLPKFKSSLTGIAPPVDKMGDEIECPWEDKFSRRFDQLSVRDDETGECWDSTTASSLLPSSSSAGSSGASTVSNCNNNVLMPTRLRLFSSLTPFKIPKEYSGLGCSSQPSEQKGKCFEYTSIKPEKHPESLIDGEKPAIVATFPAQGKLLGFCRKRRCSGSSNAPVPARASTSAAVGGSGDCCTVPRFLEGREGLLFVGRLFFAFLLLLSPGYMFPLLVIIRTFCHVQRHCHSFDEDETLLVQPRSPSFGYFGTRRFLEMNCRFCREDMKSEKMYRIHVKNGPTLSQRQHLTDRQSQNEGCCHHHH